MKNKNILITVILAFITFFMILDPKQSIDACFNGLKVWSTTLVPALFPFFFITKILSELNVLHKLGSLFAPITKKLYNVPGISGYVYIMGIVSGYPVSAKITSDLYKNNLISKGQACRITAFTSTSGPLFVIGSVGIGMFLNKQLGFVILISHILGAFLNGLIYRNYMKDENTCISPTQTAKTNENMLENCMLASIKSVLVVGGYVCFFFMVITIINSTGILAPINAFLAKIFNINYTTISSLTNGLIEVTKGCFDLSLTTSSLKTLCVLATGMISFGGFSIFLQSLTFLKSFNISTKYFLCVKLTQTIISCVIAYVLAIILL